MMSIVQLVSVVCEVGVEERKHGVVEKCIGCPCSLAIAKVLKRGYVVRINEIPKREDERSQTFSVFPAEALEKDSVGELFLENPGLCVYDGDMPRNARYWQHAHLWFDPGGQFQANFLNDEEHLEQVPGDIRDGLEPETIEDFRFEVRLPRNLVRAAVLKKQGR